MDGGKTFLSSVPISETYSLTDRPMVVSVRDRTANGAISLDLLPGHFVRRAGDTAGMTADANGVFHPLWVDNRGGIPQAWTARVTVGDATEVTSRVSASLHEILLTGGRHVTAKLRVRNTSDNVIAAPYFVRVTAPDINPDILTWEIEEPLKAGEMSPDHELAFDLASALDPAVMTPTFKLAGLQVKVYLHK